MAMASPATAVFDVPELLEDILARLPSISLFVLQRVSKTFQATICGSARLQCMMWLRYGGTGGATKLLQAEYGDINPLIIDYQNSLLLPSLWDVDILISPEPSELEFSTFEGLLLESVAHSDKALYQPSWTKTLVTSSVREVRFTAFGDLHDWETEETVVLPAGATMGDLEEQLERVKQEFLLELVGK